MNKKRKMYVFVGCIFVVVSVLVFVWFQTDILSNYKQQKQIKKLQETSVIEAVNRFTVVVPGLKGKYTYGIVNDTHLMYGDDDYLKEYREFGKGRAEEFSSFSGKQNEETFDEIVGALDRMSLNGIIFNGDIVDYLSIKTYTHLTETLDGLNSDYIYLRSDHDFMNSWVTCEEEKFLEMQNDSRFNDGIYILENDELVILGINYSYRSIDDVTLKEIKSVWEKGKPIILCSHVPYDAIDNETLYDFSVSVKGQNLTWGMTEKNYYIPNTEAMQEFYNMIFDDNTPVIAIVAAHLHAQWNGMLNENVAEFICPPDYTGTFTIMEVVGG